MFAGSVFGRMRGLLEATPGLIILVPALLALRGNINAATASRLSTAVHMGLVPADVPYDAEVRANIGSSIVLGTLMGAFAGVLAHLASTYFSGESAGLVLLALIGTGVGLLSGFAMMPITTRTVRIAFRRGLDPDNVVAPILLMLGDLITIFFLFAVAFVLGGVF